ncbi:hypothetical protein EV191_10484 [Tamaricihabitans halophyticus]|uniref:Uncharacterized protein n=1 Tax=Tamaricihabitans halophyticus TaxID=1262583 RepID=A0A4R2QUW7_9PSEU|nr:hypothetical protein EV191_10484 [Tamaricihabitans halophyticus]
MVIDILIEAGVLILVLTALALTCLVLANARPPRGPGR